MADRPLTQKRPRVHLVHDEHGNLTDYYLEPTEEQWARAWRCWLLAPTLEIYEALLRGENVPLEQLRPEGVRRLYKRPA